MKKAAKMTLAVMLCLFVALTGCTDSSKETSSDKSGESLPVSAPGVYPIVKEKLTFKVFTQQDPFVENYETNDFTKWYEEKTNIHIDWEAVPSSAIKEKLQVKLATTDLPDMLMNASITDSQVVMFGSQGMFMALNTLIDKYGRNIKNMLEKAPEVKSYTYTPDGNIYSVPSVNESTQQAFPKKMWIYKPWLDKLGLKMPETTEEFYQVLKAFKEKDPNNNGKPDEVPLAGCNADKNVNNEVESFLMLSFIFYDKANYLYMDKDKVNFVADKDEYKEGLRYMKKLFDEGLIAKDSFIQDRKALTALTENDTVNKLGAAPAYALGHFTIDVNSKTNRYREFVNVPPLKGPSGLQQAYDRGIQVLIAKFALTRNCKNPGAAIRWIDWFYDCENMIKDGFHAGMGKEGTGWRKAAKGSKGLDGSPAEYERIIPGGVKQNHHWWQSYPTYMTLNHLMKISATADKDVIVYQEAESKYRPYSVKKVLPNLFLTEEQLALSGDLKSNIKKTVDNFQVKFITGILDLDKDWDSYLNELKNAKADEYVRLMQQAYDSNRKFIK